MESIAAALRLEKKARFVPGAMVGVDTEAMQNGQRVTGPTLALEAPLFDQGQPALARLVAVYSQARDDFEAAEVNVRSEVREGQAAVAAARESVAFAQDKLLPLRRQILRDTLLQYNAMQKSSYDLLWAREREQEAERSAVEASRDYWLARVSLERALGGRLPGETNSIATRPPDQPVPAESEHAHHH